MQDLSDLANPPVLTGAPSRARLPTLDEMLAKVVGHFESNPGLTFRLPKQEDLEGHGDFGGLG